MYREIKRALMTLLLSAAMACTVVGCGQKTESTTAAAAGNTAEVQAETEKTAEVQAGAVEAKSDAAVVAAYEKADEYLSSYYGIEPDQEITLDGVNKMIEALGGEPITGEVLSDGAVIKAGIKLAGLDELAQSYLNEAAPDKAAKVLEASGVLTEEEYMPYVACAVDLDLYAQDRPFDVKLFLYRCMEIAGKGRHYLGRISDDDLMEEMYMMLDSMSIFENWELEDVGTKLVLDEIVTGYGLKYAGYDAHFLDPYTIKYSHSDFQHAVQLAGLMRSEGMDGYIQLEPKVSVFEYLKEWGTPPEPSPTYAVQETESGRYLCYSIEYDMMIEFDSAEEKEEFHGIIENYAKKYDDRVDENGNVTTKLLAESWWQPLYSSATPMENEEYQEMIDNVVYDRTKNFSIHTFTLPEGASAVTNKVAEIAPELEMSPSKVYANPAFVRYVTGTDHQ